MILAIKDTNGEWIQVPAIVGPPGPVPVKGVDYFTVEDKAELVNEVLEAMPAAEGVSV